MSRIGNLPVSIPKGVTVSVDKSTITVKGAKGTLTQKMADGISADVSDGKIEFKRATEHKRHKAMHGLYRSLVNNMIKGVSEGYKVNQELVGVGYRATNQGQMLDMVLGYSHHVVFEIPSEVKVSTKTERGSNPTITLESHDKQLLGAVAAKIRTLRIPEPYKGKGIKFTGEVLRRKAGKSAAKK
ncbi:MAG: 50S ribosomal protein L6 [Bacteroidota bacterium]